MTWPPEVRIVEVGPRDGLQNERISLPAADKIQLIERLATAGLRWIECGSFVSPRWVPSMAGTEDVFRGLDRQPGVTYSALVPNLQGWRRAKNLDVKEIAIFAAASETFSRRNTNASIDESLERLTEVAAAVRAEGGRMRGYVSCVLGCPYEGPVALSAVVRVSHALLSMGCYEISLGDTIGVGTPAKVQRLIHELSGIAGVSRLAVHFHDTYGQALANVLTALDAGVTAVDTSVAGLGGCPYAPGAAGNLATEDVVHMLDGMGVTTGVDLAELVKVGQEVSRRLERETQSKVSRALIASQSRNCEQN